MSSRLSIAVLGPLLVLLMGCTTGDDGGYIDDPWPSVYDGPLYVSTAGTGAAGLALECESGPAQGGSVTYAESLARVQDSPERALAAWRTAEQVRIPSGGYVVERTDDGRSLLSWDRDGLRTVVAVVVKEDVRDRTGTSGWGVETWAACDLAELGDEGAAALGLGLWHDRNYREVSTTTVVSVPGSKQCGWEDITWLRFGNSVDGTMSNTEFVSGDARGELAPYLAMKPDRRSALPSDAINWELVRDGRRLWIPEDRRAAYLVPDSGSGVERWPAITRPFMCACDEANDAADACGPVLDREALQRRRAARHLPTELRGFFASGPWAAAHSSR